MGAPPIIDKYQHLLLGSLLLVLALSVPLQQHQGGNLIGNWGIRAYSSGLTLNEVTIQIDRDKISSEITLLTCSYYRPSWRYSDAIDSERLLKIIIKSASGGRFQ